MMKKIRIGSLVTFVGFNSPLLCCKGFENDCIYLMNMNNGKPYKKFRNLKEVSKFLESFQCSIENERIMRG